MSNRLADSITFYLVRKNIIKKEEYEVYRYGVKHIIINVIMLTVIFVIALMFHQWVESISFFVGFMPLRIVAGGYHASTPQRCNQLSLLIFVNNLILIDFINTYIIIILPYSIVICIFIAITVFLLAPVDHKNRTLHGHELMRARRTSRWLVCCLTLLICGMFYFDFLPKFALGIMAGAYTAAVFLIIGRRRMNGGKNYEMGSEKIQ